MSLGIMLFKSIHTAASGKVLLTLMLFVSRFLHTDALGGDWKDIFS